MTTITTTTIDLNEPLPIVYHPYADRVPKKGEIITVTELNHQQEVQGPNGPFNVMFTYLTGFVVFVVENTVRPFCFVQLPSIDRYVFYDFKKGIPIGPVREQKQAYTVVVQILRKMNLQPPDSVLRRAGLLTRVTVPPTIPVLPVRTGATKTIVKDTRRSLVAPPPPVSITIRGNTIFTNLGDIIQNQKYPFDLNK